MIEAAARGTPVLAYRRGSVREVIDEGVTGMVVDDADQAVAALPTLLSLPRAEVRRAVEERFSVARMAQGYVEVYERLMTAVRREDAALPIRQRAAEDHDRACGRVRLGDHERRHGSREAPANG